MDWKGILGVCILFCFLKELIHSINVLFHVSHFYFLSVSLVYMVFTYCFYIALQPTSVQQIPIPIYAPLQGQHQAQLSLGAGPAVSQAQELFSFHFNHRNLSQPLCIAVYPHHLWPFLVLPSTTFQLSNTRNLPIGSCLSTNFKYADYSCIIWASAEPGNRTRRFSTDWHTSSPG